MLIVGGSFGLREFSQIRYDAVKIKVRTVIGVQHVSVYMYVLVYMCICSVKQSEFCLAFQGGRIIFGLFLIL